jgi:uncharacterized caspase-like protein
MAWRRLLLLVLMFSGWSVASAQTPSEQRLALVIGNAAYKNSPLVNAVNDARLMEDALRQAGFTVLRAENASIREMRRLVRDFGDRLRSSGGVGLFYFAGHGVQVRGENYLVSTDSDIRNEDEVPDDSVSASLVLEKMVSAGNRMNIVILDACRNNPFAVRARSASTGLAVLNAPSGSLVAYSTAPGSVASDGAGSNGLYTQHLARMIRQRGLPVEEVFKQVRVAVRKDSRNAQTPWENTALVGQFYFLPPPAASAASAAQAATADRAAPDDTRLELAFWDSVRDSDNAAELRAYLRQFPQGIFATLAQNRIAELARAGGTASASPAVASAATSPAAVAPSPAGVAQQVAKMSSSHAMGSMVLTDLWTGIKRSIDVAVLQSDADRTSYTTGDIIATDGSVLQFRLGDMLLQAKSGALWRIPIQAGSSGSALVASATRSDVQAAVQWKAIAAPGGQVLLDATLNFTQYGSENLSKPYGSFRATYAVSRPLPLSYRSDIRSPVGGGDRTSAELVLR